MGNLLNSVVGTLNNVLWSYILIVMLIGVGIYFTFRTGFVQFRMIKEMIALLTEGAVNKDGRKGVSSFQAFCMSTASRVGTGNLAGVAIAIAVGGPGAVFWMWLIAIIGSASAFVESTLAQIYKIKDGDNFRGGPAYYMEKALNKKWMGVIFSVLITLCFGLVFNSVQSNTIALAFNQAFGLSKITMGIIITVLTAVVIFGGLKRIAKVAELIIPFMAIAYVAVATFVVLKNITVIPQIFSLIISSAFGLNQAVGGAVGVAMMQGIKRGLFSNEAGMGSAPNAAATAHTSHPVKQGLIQALGVFTDTLLICSSTALVILISGIYSTPGLDGIQLTQGALTSQVGSWGTIFVALCILLFAYTSIIGNYYYGESNIEFMSENKNWLLIYRLSVVAMVMFGSVAKIQIVWDLADLFMALMALINLIAIVQLGPVAFAALKDYQMQKKQGKDPEFYADTIPNLKGVECWPTKKEANKIS
jgi:alanine or glycine:cation symporter, AGCS family